MKYKTTIELIAEAETEHEAVDIAGEFLRGNIESGVDMKCRTKPVKASALVRIAVLFILISVAFGATLFKYSHGPSDAFVSQRNFGAIQPPLKTCSHNAFGESWKEKENRKFFLSIKK